MKRVTVSLPDDLADDVKRSAGGEGKVSSFVAAVLAEHQSRERLDDVLRSWERETPAPTDVRRQVEAELAAVGLTSRTGERARADVG